MRCYICRNTSDTVVSQRFVAGESDFFIAGKPPKIHVCFDCMLNRLGCIRAWQDRMICVCEKCE